MGTKGAFTPLPISSTFNEELFERRNFCTGEILATLIPVCVIISERERERELEGPERKSTDLLTRPVYTYDYI